MQHLRLASSLSRAVSKRFVYVPQHARLYASAPGSVKREKVARDSRFASLTQDDINYFKSILSSPDSGLVTEESDLQPYNEDWLRKFKGNSKLALRPKTTDEVSKILTYCNKRKLAVVPQGGNTGLVGGSVPVFDEVIISTGLMNKFEAFDPVTGVLICEAGCILENIDKWLDPHGYTVPLDLGAKGSCQIGGNVSTNAGGIRLLRYNSLHANVLGLEVVLPDGTILNSINTLRKDNTGYDLKQLFIGAEGTLGLVTRVALLVPPRPSSINVAFFGCKGFDHVQTALRRAKSELGEVLSAFEFIDRKSLQTVLDHLPGTRDPLDEKHNCYILIETAGSNKEHDQEKLNAFLESILGDETVSDGIVAQDESQRASIWRLRESIGEALVKKGPVYKYDFSLPLSHFYQMVDDVAARVGDKADVMGFGHVGDGNLHLNISAPKYSKELLELVEPFVYEYTSKLKGSVSAEHGLGFMKPQYLAYSKDEHAIRWMRKVKDMFDPNGIMNPYKVLPSNE